MVEISYSKNLTYIWAILANLQLKITETLEETIENQGYVHKFYNEATELSETFENVDVYDVKSRSRKALKLVVTSLIDDFQVIKANKIKFYALIVKFLFQRVGGLSMKLKFARNGRKPNFDLIPLKVHNKMID